jgi:hypothetical protein
LVVLGRLNWAALFEDPNGAHPDNNSRGIKKTRAAKRGRSRLALISTKS